MGADDFVEILRTGNAAIRVACTLIVEYFYRKISDVIVYSSIEGKNRNDVTVLVSVSDFRETELLEIVKLRISC